MSCVRFTVYQMHFGSMLFPEMLQIAGMKDNRNSSRELERATPGHSLHTLRSSCSVHLPSRCTLPCAIVPPILSGTN